MMAIRLSLYFIYPLDFNDLSLNETLLSLFMGLRVDIITIFTFSFIFILSLLLIQNQKIRTILGLLWSLVLITIFTIAFSDVLYFDFIHRHMSNEIFNLSNDIELMVGIATNSYLLHTLATALFITLYFYLCKRVFDSKLTSFVSGKKLLIYTIISILILALGVRNSTSRKSFGIADAFAVNKVSSGNLALNGFFTVYRSAKSTQKHELLELDEAIKVTQEALQTPNAVFTDKKYPLLRSYKSKEGKKHNVVIILLESWGAEHIDGFTKYKELNVTPYFKELSSKSLKFSNFYSNGYRSIFGITSLFTGITLPSGFDYLGKGLELSNLSYLGSVAKENGYSTLAMQGSNRRSYRVDAVSHLAGFDEYYGAEDMPEIEIADEGRAPHTGTYDHNLFSFYHQKLNMLKEPFIGFAFSSTNHSDFHIPRAEFERYPHDLKNYNGALNAYIYVDNAIEKFMKSVKKEPWFDNTIFIFTSDHGSGNALNPIARKYRPDDKALDSIEHFRIPLVVYAPKIFEPQEIKTLGSHNDIFPTIVDMLGFKANIAVMGNSLFDEDVHKRFVYFFAGNLIGLITESGYIKYNFKDIVEKVGNEESVQKMKKLLFGVDSAEAQLLKQNRWAK